MPKPMTHNYYDNCPNRNATKHIADKSMKPAGDELKDGEVVTDIGASVDGSWQKRGFSSLHGVATALSVSSGKILDTLFYALLSRVDDNPRRVN